MSLKKRHEVCRASSLIHSMVQEYNCDKVIDIGCGLGYLGNSLSYVCSIDVIGVELNAQNCLTAKDRVHASSFLSEIHQLNVDNSIDCTKMLRDIITSTSNNKEETTSNACMVGLHCCADLTPATMYQFLQIETCKVLVCFGCCYHRLSLAEDNSTGSLFNCFPLSQKLTDIWNGNPRAKNTFNQYAMRQACQETAARWVCDALCAVS